MRVGVWIRVSTEDQARSDSPEHHLYRAKAYCEAKGWTVVEVYHAEGTHGDLVIDHPEMERMLRDVQSGRIEALIFSKLARLARSTRGLLEIAELFQACEVDMVSLDEAIDTSTPAGRLFYTIMAAMTQWEREEISARVRATVPVRAKLGKFLGGNARFGYRWNEANQLEIHPEEAAVRVLIYELFLKHRKAEAVAKELTQRGYTTRQGQPFTGTLVTRLILDTSAKGVRKANYTRTKHKGFKHVNGPGRTTIVKPPEDWIQVPCPAIVSEDLWNRANEILLRRRKARKPATKGSRHYLTGKVQCACRSKLYADRHGTKFRCRSCPNTIPVADLDVIYAAEVQGFFCSDARYREQLEHSQAQLAAKETLLAAKKKELAQVVRERDKLLSLLMNQQLSDEAFSRYHTEYDARQKAIESEIPALEGDLAYLKVHTLSQAQLFAETQAILVHWERFSSLQKKALVEQITDSIVVDGTHIRIKMAYIPGTIAGHTVSPEGFESAPCPLGQDSHSNPSSEVARLLAMIPLLRQLELREPIRAELVVARA